MAIDSALIKACIKGDRKSQFVLYNESFSALMSIGYRYYNNREDASAAVNNCFLKVLKGLSLFGSDKNTSSYYSWIKKIMINTVIDEFRKTKNNYDKVQTHNDETYLETLIEEDYNIIENSIQEEALNEMISRLSDLQKKVFNLYVIDGFTHKEICGTLGINLSNSKWHLSQARKQLQKELKDQISNYKSEHHV